MVAFSSDIGAIKIAEKVGDADLTQAFSVFGFGNRGVVASVDGASVGGRLDLGTTEKDPLVFVSEFANGQNSAVTPLEITQAYGALANGGKVLQAMSMDSESKSPTLISRPISQETSDAMRKVLQKTVRDGTGTRQSRFTILQQVKRGLALLTPRTVSLSITIRKTMIARRASRNL